MDECGNAVRINIDQPPAAFIEDAFGTLDREMDKARAGRPGKSLALVVAYTSATRAGIPDEWLIRLFDTTVEWSLLQSIESMFQDAAHYGLVLVHADQWIENLHDDEEHEVVIVEGGQRDALSFVHRKIVQPCCLMLFQYDLLKGGFVGTFDYHESAAG